MTPQASSADAGFRRVHRRHSTKPSSFYRAPELQARGRSLDRRAHQRVQGLGISNGSSDDEDPSSDLEDMTENAKIKNYASFVARAPPMTTRRRERTTARASASRDPAIAIQQVLMLGGLLLRTGHEELMRVSLEQVAAVREKRRQTRQGTSSNSEAVHVRDGPRSSTSQNRDWLLTVFDREGATRPGTRSIRRKV